MRIVVAEDSTLLREGLISLVQRAGHEVVAEAGDAPELITVVEQAIAAGRAPQVVITDVRMPPGNSDDGLQAALKIRAGHPEIGVLVLSQYIADAYAQELLQDSRGGVGYLLKDRIGRVTDFLRAIDVIAGGGVLIDPEVIRHLLSDSRAPEPLARLTPREREVLALMAEGRSNAEIMTLLTVSAASVSKHIGNIFLKLDLADADGHRRVRAVLAYLHS